MAESTKKGKGKACGFGAPAIGEIIRKPSKKAAKPKTPPKK